MACGVVLHIWSKFDHPLDNEHAVSFFKCFSGGESDIGADRSRDDLFFDRRDVYAYLFDRFAWGMGVEFIRRQLDPGHYRHCFKIGLSKSGKMAYYPIL